MTSKANALKVWKSASARQEKAGEIFDVRFEEMKRQREACRAAEAASEAAWATYSAACEESKAAWAAYETAAAAERIQEVPQ